MRRGDVVMCCLSACLLTNAQDVKDSSQRDTLLSANRCPELAPMGAATRRMWEQSGQKKSPEAQTWGLILWTPVRGKQFICVFSQCQEVLPAFWRKP